MLVTGASGFIGGRLVERLVTECGASVRVFVRERARAAQLSRFPIEVATGDLRTDTDVEAAMSGCEVVFNCVKATDGTPAERLALETGGVRNVLDAALRGRASRVVHVSTMVVYDVPNEGELDESATRRGSGGDLYADLKRRAEEVVRGYAGRLAVVLIQPTVVYGPRAGVYGRDLIEELRSRRIPLVDGGAGTCNALYVDDLVSALLLAATSDNGAGHAFLVSGPDHPTWREFFAAFERMLGVQRLVPVSMSEARRLWRAESRRGWLVPEALRAVREDRRLRSRLLETREGALLRGAAHRLLPDSFFAPERWPDRSERSPAPPAEPPLVAFPPEVVRFVASRARVSSTKARELLGYRPVFGFEAGMRLTEAWARWEGLLDGGEP